ncbi:uncharacterized protein LOC131333989 [Rhododendron vialii]|uniref:uncharacterized protein LOC131333989 n=1 Tax=Rhododendron vialii TaxID=182163 RepID=UPI00265E229C|nr:uncharacterized protein LOC131333989 [Rhododendron vialii]
MGHYPMQTYSYIPFSHFLFCFPASHGRGERERERGGTGTTSGPHHRRSASPPPSSSTEHSLAEITSHHQAPPALRPVLKSLRTMFRRMKEIDKLNVGMWQGDCGLTMDEIQEFLRTLSPPPINQTDKLNVGVWEGDGSECVAEDAFVIL